MIFISNNSFIYILLFIAIYNCIQRFTTNKLILNILLIFGSIAVLSTISSIQSIGIILLISSLFFAGGYFLSINKKNNSIFLFLFISILILLFIVKNYNLVGFSLLNRVGLSYILFRLIHFLVDSSQNKIHRYNLVSFLNYIIFFPTFIAGPIDQYNNFGYWLSQKRNSYKLILVKAGLFRVLLGVVKKFFLAAIIANYSTDFSLFEFHFIWQGAFIISLFLYSLYILLDFSGYSDIAIGTAYLIGIRTPENFNNPYFSKNLSVFWKRWHMTFSNFLFKYVFKPLVVFLSKLFPKYPRLSITFIGYIITFIICGIWHGNTLNFVYWGLWHGVGLILFKLWSIYVSEKYIKHLTNNFLKRANTILAILVTFIYVTIGWFFFNYGTHQVSMILGSITHFNQQELNVSTVSFNNKTCFKIQFMPQQGENELVDIEYTASKSDTSIKFYDIPASKDSTYYVFNEFPIEDLYQIKIRYKTKNTTGAWRKQLFYLTEQERQQTDIQEKIFGKITSKINTISDDEDVLGLLRLPISLKNQTIDAQPHYFPNYGWAIRISYLALPDYYVQIDYKYNENPWKTYQEKRDGKYNFGDIHGEIIHNGTDLNLAPGKYKVRIRYFKEKISSWFYGSAIIPNYNDKH